MKRKQFTARTARGLVAVLALTALASASAVAGDDDTALIERYGLTEADTPVSDRDDWQRPRTIVVGRLDDGRIEWLRERVPDDVTLVPVASEDEALEHVGDTDALVGLCSESLLERGSGLTWVQVLSAGVDGCYDAPTMQARQPLLTNMQRVTGPVIAEHVLALTLSLARGLPAYQRAQADGEWDQAAAEPITLEGRRMLVVGLGGIGIEVARRAHALGMTVHGVRASRAEGPDYVARVVLPDGLEDELANADVIVNALPLTDDTRGQFDRALFELMPSHALYINVGRGGTVVTDDLVAALEEGLIGGAGIDVTDPRPLPADHPLWKAPNTIVTPHVAARSDLGIEARWEVALANMLRYIDGEPMLSVVDLDRGY